MSATDFLVVITVFTSVCVALLALFTYLLSSAGMDDGKTYSNALEAVSARAQAILRSVALYIGVRSPSNALEANAIAAKSCARIRAAVLKGIMDEVSVKSKSGKRIAYYTHMDLSAANSISVEMLEQMLYDSDHGIISILHTSGFEVEVVDATQKELILKW